MNVGPTQINERIPMQIPKVVGSGDDISQDWGLDLTAPDDRENDELARQLGIL
jgi:hypothetical protein